MRSVFFSMSKSDSRFRLGRGGWSNVAVDFVARSVDKARLDSSVPALEALEEAVRESAAATSATAQDPTASKGTE
jgi:hypothetical protein